MLVAIIDYQFCCINMIARHSNYFLFSLLIAAIAINQYLAFSPSYCRKAAMSTSSNPKESSAVSAAGSEYGASSTSFYTTVEKKDQYESLETILSKHCSDPKVREIITDMLDVCAEITEALRSALVTVEGSMNDFGDAQLSVDVRKMFEYCSIFFKCKDFDSSLLSHNILPIPIGDSR
jgi:hypothetical protein